MRFTVTIHETDFTNALISSLHEGGHALYGQNLAPELKGTTLAWGTSWGFDEARPGSLRISWAGAFLSGSTSFPWRRSVSPC